MNNSWYARRSSAWTGKAARSVTEAFGPYTDPHVYDTCESSPWVTLVYAVVCVAACVAVGAMLALGGRP